MLVCTLGLKAWMQNQETENSLCKGYKSSSKIKLAL